MNVCHICGIPADAGYFDDATIQGAPANVGDQVLLASYQLHRNYCGVLMSFAQFTDKYALNNSEVLTTGYEWEIRCNGRPRDPYQKFNFILNPWGYSGNPVQLRLEEGCLVEFIVHNVSGSGLGFVGGRITGRYWYNTEYGGAPGRL